jgi:predicted Zn finger-like uncharacterized protein
VKVIARCPHCDTSFHVTPKQMKARSGKVRCGSCKAIFNVLEHLVEETPEVAAPRLELQWPERINRVLAMPLDRSPGDAGAATPDEAAAAAQADAPAPEVEAAAAPADGSADEPAGEPPAAATAPPPPAGDEAGGPGTPEPAAPGCAGEAVAARELRAASGYNRWAESPLSSGSIALEPPARPLSPAARTLWRTAGVLALLALVMQLSLHWRAEIAVRLPQAHPFLAALCAQFDCTIELPRDGTQVAIESSTLLTDPARPGIAMLEATLRNRAEYARALPALELTLTDAADRPLVRRVLLPADYLAMAGSEVPAAIARGFAARSELGIRLWIDVSQVAAAGYRLYLFYP